MGYMNHEVVKAIEEKVIAHVTKKQRDRSIDAMHDQIAKVTRKAILKRYPEEDMDVLSRYGLSSDISGTRYLVLGDGTLGIAFSGCRITFDPPLIVPRGHTDSVLRRIPTGAATAYYKAWTDLNCENQAIISAHMATVRRFKKTETLLRAYPDFKKFIPKEAPAPKAAPDSDRILERFNKI